MSTDKLVECVPNFSTSDPEVIALLVQSIDRHDMARVLHVDPDRDYNRTVITFIVTQETLTDTALDVMGTAFDLIDMSSHRGEHPRLGSVDVFPLIPLKSSTFNELVPLAHHLAQQVARVFNLPVYCYGKAALKEERRVLADIRRDQYEGLQKNLLQPYWEPDFGPARFDSKMGATVIGVRDFLIAYNVNLATTRVDIAQSIARRIRTSGWINASGDRIPGELSGVQAMGVTLHRPDRGTFTQVSTNVLDFTKADSIDDVFKAVSIHAQQYGVEVTGSEIVGLVPEQCLRDIADRHGFDNGYLRKVIDLLGLDDLYPFDPDAKILDRFLSSWP